MTMSDAEIEAVTNERFDPSRAVYVPGDPEAAKRVLSARVPDSTSRWIYDEALRRGISPSQLAAELLAEAIAARQGRTARLVDAEALHRAIDAMAA